MAGYWGRYMGDTPGIPLAKTDNCLVMAGMIRMFWQAPKHAQKKAISTWFIVAPTHTQRTKKKQNNKLTQIRNNVCIFSSFRVCFATQTTPFCRSHGRTCGPSWSMSREKVQKNRSAGARPKKQLIYKMVIYWQSQWSKCHTTLFLPG